MNKEHMVVMLPTDKASTIALCIKELPPSIESVKYKVGNLIDNVKNDKLTSHYWQYQHLYFLSDDKPKTDDWCYDMLIGEIFKMGIHADVANNLRHTEVKKIVATDNPELLDMAGYIRHHRPQAEPLNGICKIPTSFIEAYIKAYNAGKPIEKVMLEYEEVYTGEYEHFDNKPKYIYTLKPTPQGEVIVVEEDSLWIQKRMKDLPDSIKAHVKAWFDEIDKEAGQRRYTRDELKIAVNSLFWHLRHQEGNTVKAEDINDWFDTNYPQ